MNDEIVETRSLTGLNVGIIGAGVGGLTVAIALQQMGHRVTVFEQAEQFGRVGADINLTPNAVHALDGLGVGGQLGEVAARPTHRISRMWNDGAETSRIELRAAAQAKYGAVQLTIHRADFLKVLEAAVDPSSFRMGHSARNYCQDSTSITVQFDGSSQRFDVLIGADGIHSVIRTVSFGPESPEFTGLVSHRGTFLREAVSDLPDLDAFTKWWGPEPSRQIVTFPLSAGREVFVFATTAQDDWREESWTAPGDIEALRAAYADFHPNARALLAACQEVTRSALYVRDPMPNWSNDRVTLLGDAAHPMTPFMAQGACMAIEDGIVLARCLNEAEPQTVATALKRYEAARKDRTGRIQIASRGNEWLKKGGNADWVYGYDAWQVPI